MIGVLFGDQDAAARLYINAAIFLLGCAIATLALAGRASVRAQAAARDERRRANEHVAAADERLDGFEAGLAKVAVEVGEAKALASAKRRPARASSASSRKGAGK